MYRTAGWLGLVVTVAVAAPGAAEPVLVEGVPRLGWGIGRACAHIAALHAALTPMDCPASYEEMVVASGAAVRVEM